MTQNPFDALGGGDGGAGGGFDMGALLQQAQQMQEQIAQAQADLAEATVEGTVGGGAVSVQVTGTGDLAGVTIAPGTVDGASEEDLADLADMIVAAYRDGRAKADEMAAQALGPMTGGLGGGGGFPGLG